jgi:hypothetical protein
VVAVGPGRRKQDGDLIPMGTRAADHAPASLPNPSITSLTLNNAGPSFLSRAGVKVGDTVLLPDYGGQAVNLGDMGASKDKEMFLYSDQEILGIVESS